MITTFTPLEALLGGTLIGSAAVALMAFHGRIAGMTGILSGAILLKGDRDWRLAFLVGAIMAPTVILFGKGAAALPHIEMYPWVLLLGGALVGIGVTFGGGCTSGHGVCGIARLAPRSMVATLTFMCSTFLTVFVMRHILGGL